MNFKTLTLVMICGLSLSSCSEFLNGKRKEEKVLKMNTDQFSCLDRVPDSFRKMFEKESRPEHLEVSLECLASSLDYFKKKTKGSYASPDSYTVKNIRSFFGDYLGDRNRFSDGMAAHLMRLKKAFFGGSEIKITKTELQALIDLIRELKVEIETLRPHWNTILGKEEGVVIHAELEAANQALNRGLMRLIASTQLRQGDYSFNDFKSLISELDQFIKNSPSQKQMDLSSWMPLTEAVKMNLFGEMVEMNSAARWREAVTTITELHRLYLLYNYQFSVDSFFSRKGMKVADEMIVLLLNLLDRSWVIQKSELPFETTKLLFVRLKDKKLLPDDISAEAIDQTYRSIVRKFLEREKANREATVVGLEKNHINALKLEYEIWKSTQVFIETMPDTYPYPELQRRMYQYKPQVPTKFKGISQVLVENSWKEFVGHMNQPYPLYYMTSGSMLISRHVKALPKWNWYTLARLNVMRTMSRILLLGYGEKRPQNISEETMNAEGMIAWYDDFNLLGIEIKAFDKRFPNSGERSFFEADHFVFGSNGDGKMNSQEVFEFVNFIFSAGIEGVTNLQDSLKGSNCHLRERDTFGFPWTDEACFKKTLRARFHSLFKNIDGMQNYVSRMNDAEWEEFYNELMYFSRLDEKQKGIKLETSDIRTLVVILHYIESLFVRFDTDKDDVLSKPELIAASDTFVLFFKGLYKLNDQPKGLFSGVWMQFKNWLATPFIRHGFACVVLTGELPAVHNCGKAFLEDSLRTKQHATRLEILQTLNAFKSSIM